MSGRETVLVTGGSGFIAGHCIGQLIAAGYHVRTTVRTSAREREVRCGLGLIQDHGEQLSFVLADLSADGGWEDAVRDCRYVLHVASPFPTHSPRSDDELVIPARDGALRVLRAARDAGVERVVLTSSVAAIMYGKPRGTEPLDETSWSDPANLHDSTAYTRSKTIAERAAWDWLSREGGALELAVINPAAVLGPVLGRDYSSSIEIVKKLMEGAMPGCPRFGFPMVDVRDVADLHLRAMTNPAAKGERFIAGGPFLWLSEVATILRDKMGAQARRVPTSTLPDMLVRMVGAVDPVVRGQLHELGRVRQVTSDKAIKVLGWQPRPISEAIVACAESLLRVGIVRSV